MPDTPGSLTRHAAAAACLTLVLTSRLFAQQSPATDPPAVDFFTRYDFHMTANVLSVEDERFSWDTHFGGDLDVIDYGKGRTSIFADYEAILGDEFRAFDPNQSYYVLEVASSYRLKQVEVAGVFHHVSRHISDRFKRDAIAWNVLGVRVRRRLDVRGLSIDTRAAVGSVVQHSWVDYTWRGDVDVTIRRTVSPRVSVFGRGYGEVFGVEGTVAGRGPQRGGTLEGGLRFEGRAAAFELFAGVERRIDADPRDRLPIRSGIAGFRLLSK